MITRVRRRRGITRLRRGRGVAWLRSVARLCVHWRRGRVIRGLIGFLIEGYHGERVGRGSNPLYVVGWEYTLLAIDPTLPPICIGFFRHLNNIASAKGKIIGFLR